MKKTLSVFLSFVMLFACLCVGGVSAQAAEKKTKITYLYEPETQTLYIRGKGAVPAYYIGWQESKNDDSNDKFSERDEYYGIVKELSLIHISEPTRLNLRSRMPSSA